jgi:hypothetical protein
MPIGLLIVIFNEQLAAAWPFVFSTSAANFSVQIYLS